MPGSGELVFPHPTRRRTRRVQNHGLEGRATLKTIERNLARSFREVNEGLREVGPFNWRLIRQ